MNALTAMTTITTSQTIGPFPHEAWRWAFDPGTSAPLRVAGRVFDGQGEPVPDAILEAWVPAATGPIAGPIAGLRGLHRVPTGEQGEFSFELTERPAAGEPAAHVTLFGRGVLKHQFTAVFLADDPALEASPLWLQVPEARRATLLAQPVAGGYRWDVHLQGPQETVFFDYE